MKNKTIDKFTMGEIARLSGDTLKLEAELAKSRDRALKAIPKDPNYKSNYTPVSISGISETNYDTQRNSKTEKES